jgi:glutathione synthase
MTLRVAYQMDHIARINIRGDSTFALMLEGERRGHAQVHYTPDRLVMKDGKVGAKVEPVTVRDTAGDHYTLGAPEMADLSTFDVIHLRQDPPFDMGYITSTHILERIHPKTLVVNDPAHVRNAPEKLFVTEFTDLTPPTLIARDRDAIADFRREHGDIIIKPLYGNGGAGVFRIAGGEENFAALLEMFETAFREAFVVQRYLPEVSNGDKRIILVDGEPVGAINRVPAEHDSRSNMHVGGRAEATELTAREREICAAIGPTLRQQGLLFVGIDVIGDWLTEINVTSPTGIQEIHRLDGIHIEAMIWDAIERRLAERGSRGRPA